MHFVIFFCSNITKSLVVLIFTVWQVKYYSVDFSAFLFVSRGKVIDIKKYGKGYKLIDFEDKSDVGQLLIKQLAI